MLCVHPFICAFTRSILNFLILEGCELGYAGEFFFFFFFKLQYSFLWLIDPLVFKVHFYVLMKLLSSFFCCSVVKHLESANTMFSFIWWIIGFYWVNAGGQHLTEDAPQLYWLVQ